MAWALVTPSSRGIGHALTRHLLLTTPANLPIVATTRSDPATTRESLLADLPQSVSSPSLSSLQRRLDVQHCELTSPDSIRDLAAYCSDRYHHHSQTKDPSPSSPHLRLAFCIPGTLHPERSPTQIDHDTALSTLRLNLLAPMMLAKHFTPLLPSRKTGPLPQIEGLNDSAVLAFMSARVGSISDNRGLGGWYSYRCSKAGVNQLVKSLDIHLQRNGGKGGARALCVGLHPGTVRTELSREFWGTTPKERLFEPEWAAERLVEVVKGLEGEQGGRCWDWKGVEIMP